MGRNNGPQLLFGDGRRRPHADEQRGAIPEVFEGHALADCLRTGKSVDRQWTAPLPCGSLIPSDLRDLALRRSGTRLRHGANARIDEEDPPMTDVDGIQYRLARGSDAPAVAALHADSWRRHYRGAYSDA